jgi:hypothetical protein
VLHAVLTPRNLPKLDRFQVIVLPELHMVEQREVDALRRYVERGGSLYVSRSTSLLTSDGRRQADFLLSDLCGVSYSGVTAEEVTYMSPTTGNEALFAPYTARHPLTILGSQMEVKALQGAQVLATIALPYTDPKDPTRFASAISNPPGVATAHPALVLNRYGKGKVLYSSGCLERVEHEAHRVIFRRLVDLLVTRPYRVKTSAPRPVEITVFDQASEKRFLVNILNFQAELPSIPVQGLRVALHMAERRAAKVVRLPDREELPFRNESGYVEFEVKRLDTFQMVAVIYGPEGR